MPKSMASQSRLITYVIGAIIALAIIGGIYSFITAPAPVTSSTTTVLPSRVFQPLSSCSVISSPGYYNLTSNLTTNTLTGACIKVTSSSVHINGNGHSIVGNGPFVSNPPYSYGISLSGVTNVTVQHLTIAKFSFGIYVNNSNQNNLSNLTIQNITVGGIFLSGAHSNLVANNRITSVYGQGGGVLVQNGGNNTVSGSSIKYNSYYGIVVNSSGNKFLGDALVGNPVDIACQGNFGYSSYNKASNVSCYVNHYCNFATCAATNIPAVPQEVSLQPSVNQCGIINYGGTYTLTQSLNTQDFINTNLTQTPTPCITVNASNVNINCKGYAITNGPYGIAARNTFNISVSNCNFNKDNYGIFFSTVAKFGLHNITASNNTYGVYSTYSTGGNFTNVVAFRNKYGIYVNGSTYATLTRFNTTNNTYGIFMDNSTSLSLNYGIALSDSKTDLACTASTYNSTLSTITDTNCGSTDCIWATSCPIHTLPSLTTYPVTQCTTITVPGQYAMNANLQASAGNCFTVKASNVSITCNNHAINGQGSGAAISVSNETNVALFNCIIYNFGSGIYAANTKYLVLQNIHVNLANYGISTINSQNEQVSNNTVGNFSNAGYYFLSDTKGVVTNDQAYYGLNSSGSGFLFAKSFNNTIINNFAVLGHGFGFIFQNNSQSNFIKNNTGSQNKVDYACYSGSTGTYSNKGSINNGLTKQDCQWLVANPPAALQTTCSLNNVPTTITLGYDMVYPYGNTCFSIYSVNSIINAHSSTINCAGHTVYSTNGGTFVKVTNTSQVTIENCILYGFNTPIVFTGPKSSLTMHDVVLNNTIINATGTAISASYSQGMNIAGNNVTYSSNAITLYNSNYSTLQNNMVSFTNNAITIINSTGLTVKNNSASSLRPPLSLYNVTGSSFGKNNFTAVSAGVFCSSSSSGKGTGNLDLGGNMCEITNCLWMSASPLCT